MPPPPFSLRADLIERIRRQTKPIQPIPTAMPSSLQPLPDIRAVLFDIYGTLMISAAGDIGTTISHSRTELLEAAFKATGFPTGPGTGEITLQRYAAAIQSAHAANNNRSTIQPEVNIVEIWREVVHSLILEGRLKGPVPEPKLQTLAVELELRQNPVWMMPGATEILETLSKHGFTTGLVSNAQFYTPLMIEALTGKTLDDLGFARNLRIWSWETGEAKPSPTLWKSAVLTLSSRHGIPPQAVLAVGNDVANDIVVPRQLGCHTALFAGDARSLRLAAASCGTHAADVVLTDLRQLSQVLIPTVPE